VPRARVRGQTVVMNAALPLCAWQAPPGDGWGEVQRGSNARGGMRRPPPRRPGDVVGGTPPCTVRASRPAERHSSHADAPDSPARDRPAPQGRAGEAAFAFSLREVGVNRRHTKAPPHGPSGGAVHPRSTPGSAPRARCGPAASPIRPGPLQCGGRTEGSAGSRPVRPA